MPDPFLFNFREDMVVVAATFTVPLPGAFVRQAIGSTQRCGCHWWFRTGFWHDDAMAVWCMGAMVSRTTGMYEYTILMIL